MKKPIFVSLFLNALCAAATLLLALLATPSILAEDPPSRVYAVELSATVQTSPPQIRLTWPGDSVATSYALYRKSKEATSWGSPTTLPGSATSYTDSNVTAGGTYEYQVLKTTSVGYPGTGYLLAGLNAPAIDNRGAAILIVDDRFAGPLAAELARFKQDLTGDGWTVIRRDVSAGQSPPDIKNIIKSIYQTDPARTKALILFGHIPVAYSGDIFPDGHENHRGAWPADPYYADMDGVWRDSTVISTNAEREVNWNVPNDGKFDESILPSDVELETGRIDFYEMTNFSNKQPPRSELDLLRQYLNKNHRFRHGGMAVQRRGMVVDHFGLRGKDAVASTGFRNFSAFFTAANVHQIAVSNYLATLRTDTYLWAYGAGGGGYYYSAGVAGADDFAIEDIKVVFTMFLGSYYGDWNNESNFLRSAIGSTTYVLASIYSGFPHTFVHSMGLGETIGYGMKLTMNNKTNGVYLPQGQGTYQPHVALMGDPTLRLHPVLPPSNLSGTATASGATLNWSASTDSNIIGYHVYRSASAEGPFTRVTTTPLTAATFTDQPSSGTYTYMVRALKLEQSGSGTYENPSQGVFTTVTVTGQTPTPMRLSVIQSDTTRLTLRISGQSGQSYTLESSEDLRQWAALETNRLRSSSQDYTEQFSPNRPRRFFRVRTN